MSIKQSRGRKGALQVLRNARGGVVVYYSGIRSNIPLRGGRCVKNFFYETLELLLNYQVAVELNILRH